MDVASLSLTGKAVGTTCIPFLSSSSKLIGQSRIPPTE